MKILKWGGLGLLGALVLLILLNWAKIQRLLTVNSLFDPDKIVANFSSMDSAFLHHDLTLGEAKPWPEDIQDLPETVMLAGVEANLAAALEELDTTALVIIRDGTLIHESYYKDTQRDDLRISWSVAKSFMSGLYGQAIEDGLMDISQPIETYLPQLKGTAYEGATVANILNMASGVKFNEDYLDPKSDINDMGRVLGLGGSMDNYTETLKERQSEPGSAWQYVSIDTHVAAMALRKVTGKSLHQLWEETYGANLGMGKNPFYLTDGHDVAFALGGLNLRTRDYAKFGQLFLQGGEWEGEQLVPADWVKASTVNHAPNLHPVRGSGYGYQWWVPMPQAGPSKGDYFAVGIYGQYIYVNPAMNIVIAKNAADREFTVPQSNGQHSMNMNIDIFRSLAEQMHNKELVCRGDINEEQKKLLVSGIVPRDKVLRTQNLSPNKKAIALSNGCKSWEEWANDISGIQASVYTASCERSPDWVCNLVKDFRGETTKTDVTFLVDSAAGKVGFWEDGYDRIDVTDISVRVEFDYVWVQLNAYLWKDGQRYTTDRDVLFINGERQYQ